MGLRGRWLLGAGTACLAILLALGIYRVLEEPGLSPEEAARAARLNGIWRSRGYGWVWEIADGRLSAYDESGSYCLARPDIRRRLKDISAKSELSADGRELRLSLDDPAYRFTFDRIEALPPACSREPSQSPPAVFDALGDIFSAHYAFFKARSVDWPALIAAARSKVTADMSQADLLAEIGAVLAHIDDDHVTLVADIDGDRFECDPGGARLLRRGRAAACPEQTDGDGAVARLQKAVWERQATEGLLGETARTAANGNIKYGRIGGDIGYLSLLSMEDFGDDDEEALNEALDAAIALFEGARSVIVDVSLNDGGEDKLARAITARFAQERTLVYAKHAGDAPGAQPQAIYLSPSARPRFTGPVYLMTSNVTVSAAEIFTLAMRALPNVTHVGETTRGALSDVLTTRLPNGWVVTLSNEVYVDAAGKAWEGKGMGIAPTLALPVLGGDPDPAAAHARALDALLERIGAPHI